MIMMNEKKASLLMGELIGETAEVTKSPQREQIGISGVIVDETLKTITIETKKGEKKVAKAGAEFAIRGEKIKGDEISF
ncbi:MAG: ribonuclease P protein subunit, partial [archaeon]